MEAPVRALALAVTLVFATGSAFAADSCTVESSAKKLAGAAKASFMKKCEGDAKASCDKEAATKKLAGAAKTSFTTKCVKDAVGS
jgi:hypothetical protein